MENITRVFGKDCNVWLDQFYDSKVSDSSVPQLRTKLLLEYLDQAKFKPGSVLDVGCGDGRFLQAFSEDVIGIGVDASEEMTSLAQKRLRGAANRTVLNFRADDISEATVGLQDIDLITLLGVIHYMSDPVNSLQKITNLLSDQGLLIITFRNRLFNLRSDSKYYNSEETSLSFDRLSTEAEVLRMIENDVGSAFYLDLEGFKDSWLASDGLERADCEGVNDLSWNPSGFEFWRQFSPLDAIKLGNKLGLELTSFIPVSAEHQSLSTSSVFTGVYRAGQVG